MDNENKKKVICIGFAGQGCNKTLLDAFLHEAAVIEMSEKELTRQKQLNEKQLEIYSELECNEAVNNSDNKIKYETPKFYNKFIHGKKK